MSIGKVKSSKLLLRDWHPLHHLKEGEWEPGCFLRRVDNLPPFKPDLARLVDLFISTRAIVRFFSRLYGHQACLNDVPDPALHFVYPPS